MWPCLLLLLLLYLAVLGRSGSPAGQMMAGRGGENNAVNALAKFDCNCKDGEPRPITSLAKK